MNPTTETQPALVPSPTPSNTSPDTTPRGPSRRRRGKVALLPKTIRDQINQMLDDGIPYRIIIQKLQAPDAPPLPHAITEHNLSEWKDGGYQDWLKNQFWQDELRARHDSFTGVLNGADPIHLPESGLQLAAVGVCELLRDLCPGAAESNADPEKYIRAANSLARLSRSILQLQQYRDACAQARALLRERKDPKRRLNESETRTIVRCVEDILGVNDEYAEELIKAAIRRPGENGNKSQEVNRRIQDGGPENGNNPEDKNRGIRGTHGKEATGENGENREQEQGEANEKAEPNGGTDENGNSSEGENRETHGLRRERAGDSGENGDISALVY